jgi:hypothetical protein
MRSVSGGRSVQASGASPVKLKSIPAMVKDEETLEHTRSLGVKSFPGPFVDRNIRRKPEFRTVAFEQYQ